MRIVSLLPSTTEIVCALGLEDALVGITHECDYPASVVAKPRLTASRISQETMSSKEIDHAVRSQPSTTTTAEEICAYAPEVIMLIPCGYYKEDILRQLPSANLPAGWRDLAAVRNGEVWVTDATSYFSRPGPRVVDGVEILARILHPEIFGAPGDKQAVRVH
jgi:ABC-type Fe3+-hydroxamate transport system substrate-binding protein